MRELIGKVMTIASAIAIAEAVNMGRDEGFEDVKEAIGAFQWSALLDEHTCPLCQGLDGKYFEPDDPQFKEIEPPLHPNCRCIKVAVLKEELVGYPVKVTYLTPLQVSRLTVGKLW